LPAHASLEEQGRLEKMLHLMAAPSVLAQGTGWLAGSQPGLSSQWLGMMHGDHA